MSQKRFFLSPSDQARPHAEVDPPGVLQDGCELAGLPGAYARNDNPQDSRNGLFFANAGGKGYYRSAYPPSAYAALVAQVETALTPAERISLTGDEWAQVRARQGHSRRLSQSGRGAQGRSSSEVVIERRDWRTRRHR